MGLDERQKKKLRGLGHALNPVVLVGDAGASAGVIRELDLALTHHELVKVKVRAADRAARDAIIVRLNDATGAETVQRIGNVALLYRRNPQDPRIAL